MANKPFVEHQVDRLICPGTNITGDNLDVSNWISFILEFTKRTEAGKWNEKCGVIIFKANYGYHSAMRKIVKDTVEKMKKEDPKTIVMEEVDDNKVRTWVVGNSDKIKQMVNDELKQ